MVKRLFGLVIIAAVFMSCGSNAEKKSDADAKESALSLEFAALIDNPEAYLAKEISLEGNVVHVCKHSGKKMFIVGENPDIRLYISAGEEVPKFPMELLGSTVTVTGLLSKVEAGEKIGEGAGEGEHKEEKKQRPHLWQALLMQIVRLRQQLQLSQYWLIMCSIM